eukprot:CAMPEP_0118695866 /NCGR_PEP_ID=MMETSP0800-20121206/13470_1 /TAXON_ID=210618 ORGANISM="Striatella unipunctata, Strain CCMP2910" /NCGR_SAMPLE_ID=MMETSP0800 /ASSEMBLY_ACC=CAM_ASM_000638 /LENGTH=48 /DNA_ID= /DNA_START= /DNA_END= /DNA_ORIENTATION=
MEKKRLSIYLEKNNHGGDNPSRFKVVERSLRGDDDNGELSGSSYLFEL